MKIIDRIRDFFLIATLFFLPINLNLNNIFLVGFIGLYIIQFVKEPKTIRAKILSKNKWTLFIVISPFLLNLSGLLYTDELNLGIDYSIRAIPFLFLPLISILNPEIFNKNHKRLGYALVVGCLITAFYSWGHSLFEIWSLGKPLKELFGPLYSHHNLVKSLDLHAAYLSIFIYSGIGFLVLELKKDNNKKMFFIMLILVLTVFMLHLLSRNALLYFILSSVLFMIYFKKWKILALGSISILILAFLAYNVKHNYLRDRLFKSLNLFEKDTQFSKKDDRFDRLSASYEVFKQSPLIGYGTAAESKHRREIFLRNKDMVAHNNNYNAHNQFFEYLSTYGIVGGVTFLVFFILLFKLCIQQKNAYFLFLVTGLFLGCLTESIFERSNGVVYTAILIALLLSFNKKLGVSTYVK